MSKPDKYVKFTNGFVCQEFVEKDGKYVCVHQEFEAGDVFYEDGEGNDIEVDDVETKEVYQPFNMVQPE